MDFLAYLLAMIADEADAEARSHVVTGESRPR
jgi:hypothetical protein